jgi:hypothetical protein
LKRASHDWLISIVYHLNTLRPSTFILSNLVLIFTPEYVIKISCGSSGTPGIKKKLEAFKLEQDLGLGPSKFTDDVLKFE